MRNFYKTSPVCQPQFETLEPRLLLSALRPDLAWLTYLGNDNAIDVTAMTMDSAGNTYVTGEATANGLATAGAYKTSYGGGSGDAFVAKIDATGTALTYFTYLGGSGTDYGYGIAVDSAGNAYVSGWTTSTTGIASTGAYKVTYGGGSADGFVIKINSTGTARTYGTYLGGTAEDAATAVAVDSAGNAYIAGETFSSDLATVGAYDTTYASHAAGKSDQFDVFVTKLNTTGTALTYLTYLGGTSSDVANGIAIDSAGNAYITGGTQSSGLATPGAYDTTQGGANLDDAFVAEFNSTGTALTYFTYLGGSSGEAGNAIALDSANNAYIAGSTASTSGMATAGAYDTTFNGGQGDVFAAKFNSTGTSLVYCTYLGGSGNDIGSDLAVDSAGNAYITGETYSSGLGTTGAFNTTYVGSGDAFVAKINPTGASLNYFSYLGGTDEDWGSAIALDSSHNPHIAGGTFDAGLATPGAYDTTYSSTGSDTGTFDMIVAKFNDNDNRPTIASITTPSTPQSGNVTIHYSLSDLESDTCSIAVAYSLNGGGTWLPATSGPGGDGTSSLTSSPVGVDHTFVWASASNIVNASNTNVTFRITPADPVGNGTPSITGTFGVYNAAASQLVFTTQPVTTPAPNTLAPIQVSIKDTSGNVLATDNSSITLSVASGPGTLAGTVTVAALNGVATFNNLSIAKDGTYTLSASDSADSLSGFTSTSFKILAPGDADGNGTVDGADLALWQQNYDPSGTTPADNDWAHGNWNADNKIDGADLALWQQNYNPSGAHEVVQSESTPPAEVSSPAGAPAVESFNTPVTAVVQQDEPLLTSATEPAPVVPSQPVALTVAVADVTAASPTVAAVQTGTTTPALELPAPTVASLGLAEDLLVQTPSVSSVTPAVPSLLAEPVTQAAPSPVVHHHGHVAQTLTSDAAVIDVLALSEPSMLLPG